MIRRLFVAASILTTGCAAAHELIVLEPVEVIESSRSFATDTDGSHVVRADEGVWLYRRTYRPFEGGRDSLGGNQGAQSLYLAGIEVLFCPGRGDDLTKCRSGVLWAAGKDPRTRTP